MAIVAEAADDVVAERVLALLATPSVRRTLLGDRGTRSDDGEISQALADLGSAQSRLHALDDDYYVRGVLVEGRYRSVKAKLEREIDRLRVLIDGAIKSRIARHPDPRQYRADADISQRRDSCGYSWTRCLPARLGVPRFDPQRLEIELSRAVLDSLSDSLARGEGSAGTTGGTP